MGHELGTEFSASGLSDIRDASERDGRELDGFLDSVLDPVDALGTTVVPLLHPSYADVWRSRLDYDREGYRTALAAVLRDCGVDATK